MLHTHQRTEVAASFRQKLAKPGPLEPNQVARLSQKVEGDICHLAALLVNAVLTEGFAGSTWCDTCGMLVTEVDK